MKLELTSDVLITLTQSRYNELLEYEVEHNKQQVINNDIFNAHLKRIMRWLEYVRLFWKRNNSHMPTVDYTSTDFTKIPQSLFYNKKSDILTFEY